MTDLISRQAAIDAVERVIPDNRSISVCDAIKTLPSAQQWIPCSERLPEEDNRMGENRQYSDYVLMSVYNAEYKEAFIDYGHTVDGNWQSDTTDCLVPPWWEVVAWMPLPKPYHGGKNENR